MSNRDIAQQHILEGPVWLFDQENPFRVSATSVQFRNIIARALGVNLAECRVVGSAKSSFSFTPSKNYRAFSQSSDIDTIIVSRKLFERLWDSYLELYYEREASVKAPMRNAFFKKFVSVKASKLPEFSTNKIIDLYQMFGEIQSEVEAELAAFFPVNFRVYETFEAATLYHSEGVRILRKLS